MGLFDNILYGKGSAVVRMARALLGEEGFWAAMREYLREHQFGTAVTEDLLRQFDWQAKERKVGTKRMIVPFERTAHCFV